jgi:outer membrane protein TolC
MPLAPLLLQLLPLIIDGVESLLDNGDISQADYDAAIAQYKKLRGARQNAVANFYDALKKAEESEKGKP